MINGFGFKSKMKELPSEIDDMLIPLSQLSDKLILGGSSALYLLGIMPRVPEDLDFSLSEKLTKEEFIHIKDFFNLSLNNDIKEYGGLDEKHSHVYFTTDEILERDLIQFFTPNDLKIDFFNNKTVEKRNILIVPYKGFKLKITHPSYIISAKAKYAFDSRIHASYKHMTDLKQIMNEPKLKEYFDITKDLWLNQENETGNCS